MGMPLKYYYDLKSQPCRAVYIFLKMENIPFDSVEINIRAGEHRADEFLAINPLGKVPVIIDNGFVLSESVAILKYLSEKYASSDRWFPKNLAQRAKVDEYCAWQHGNTRMKSVAVFWREVLFRRPPHRIQRSVDEMNIMLDEFKNMFLKGKKFITGDRCTAADLLAACEFMQVTVSGRDPFIDRPVLRAWMQSVRSYTNPYFDEAHGQIYEWKKSFLSQKL